VSDGHSIKIVFCPNPLRPPASPPGAAGFLSFDPVTRATGPVARAEPLADDPVEAELPSVAEDDINRAIKKMPPMKALRVKIHNRAAHHICIPDYDIRGRRGVRLELFGKLFDQGLPGCRLA
jgi:hypothetical protein